MSQSDISPVDTATNGSPPLTIEPHATLVIPRRRRFVHNYVRTEEGKTEVVLYFGEKEIRFDDPELFAFAESLCKHDSFVAGSAITWAEGAPYAWDRVKELLEALVAEGIVAHDVGDPVPLALDNPRYRQHMQDEADRRAPSEPLWWNPDCASVLEKIAGRPLELGYVETVVPVYRVAHAALDAEGRHVGEMNVFPAAMRMKRPTETRQCKYAGSRYEYDLPMNMTALNAMRRHWRSMRAGVLLVREEVLRRYPLGADGVWTLGDLHALACAELAVASVLVMRGDAPVPNGALDPVLSSIFRVSDGVRMVAMYAINFIDDPRPYDSPITTAELLRITEERDHFLSNHGACAGPPNMVQEFLETLIDGRPPAGEPPPLGDWVSEIPRAVDYALLGVQLHALLSTLWLRMAEAYAKIRALLLAGDLSEESPFGRLRARVERDWEVIRPTHLDRPQQRSWEEARFTELFERAQRGLCAAGEGTVVRLADVLTPTDSGHPSGAARALRSLLGGRAGDPGAADILDEVADALLDYVRVERAALRSVAEIQRAINALLRRPHPTRPLSGVDLAIHHTLRVGTPGAVPYLLHAFRDEMGIEAENTAIGSRLTCGAAVLDLDG